MEETPRYEEHMEHARTPRAKVFQVRLRSLTLQKEDVNLKTPSRNNARKACALAFQIPLVTPAIFS